MNEYNNTEGKHRFSYLKHTNTFGARRDSQGNQSNELNSSKQSGPKP